MVKCYLVSPYRTRQRTRIQLLRKRNPKEAFLFPCSMRMSGLLFTQWRELWISCVPAWQSEVDPVLESSDVRPQTVSPLPFNFAQYLIRMVRKDEDIVEKRRTCATPGNIRVIQSINHFKLRVNNLTGELYFVSPTLFLDTPPAHQRSEFARKADTHDILLHVAREKDLELDAWFGGRVEPLELCKKTSSTGRLVHRSTRIWGVHTWQEDLVKEREETS